jgi:hypothetical protein
MLVHIVKDMVACLPFFCAVCEAAKPENVIRGHERHGILFCEAFSVFDF